MTLKIAEIEKSVLTVEESMSTKISVIEAVSYTHLDVYKRQVVQWKQNNWHQMKSQITILTIGRKKQRQSIKLYFVQYKTKNAILL